MPKNTSGLLKGGPGRKPGIPNKATVEAKEACAKLVDDPAYRAKLRERLLRGKLAPAVETMLWHYAHGKPKETVSLEGQVSVDHTVIRESLASRIASLAARLRPGSVAGESE